MVDLAPRKRFGLFDLAQRLFLDFPPRYAVYLALRLAVDLGFEQDG